MGSVSGGWRLMAGFEYLLEAAQRLAARWVPAVGAWASPSGNCSPLSPALARDAPVPDGWSMQGACLACTALHRYQFSRWFVWVGAAKIGMGSLQRSRQVMVAFWAAPTVLGTVSVEQSREAATGGRHYLSNLANLSILPRKRFKFQMPLVKLVYWLLLFSQNRQVLHLNAYLLIAAFSDSISSV